MRKITVLLADDHIVVRQGLRALLQAEADVEVICQADTGVQAVELTRKHMPDVVVMDISMPLLNGLEATKQIMRAVPTTRVLILSANNDDEFVNQATESGAAGYLVKQTAATDLLKAVREVKKGNAFFSPSISRRMIDNCRNSFLRGTALKKDGDLLTLREKEVLQLIAGGMANKQMAVEMCISIKTVEKHRQQVMNKLRIHEVAGLTRYAVDKGIVEADAALAAH
jgi:DNA-binding NarL/FixJ family response regulator